MRNRFLILLFSLSTLISFCQENGNSNQEKTTNLETTNTETTIDSVPKWKPTYIDYKIISYENDTTIIDTTLTIQKDYKFNYIRKDDFELMAFSNQGQQYNYLGYDYNNTSMYPKMGMKGKHFDYKEIEDINYYNVPTPTTELMWRTGLSQGQTLDALVTMNLTPKFNFSLEYKGLRSLGKYRQTLSAHKNFRATANYTSKNDRYFARGHFVSHDLENQENGGLTEQSIILFESNDPDFTDRGRLDVNFNDALNNLSAKRYHYEHNYKFLNTEKASNIKLGHHFNYETKHYHYFQTANDLVGDSYDNNIFDDAGLKTMNNDLFLSFDSPYVLGRVTINTGLYNYNHYFNGQINLVNQVIEPQLKGNASNVGATWNARIGNFALNADANTIFAGDITGHNFTGTASYVAHEWFNLSARLSEVSKSPDFNYLHHQSDYIEYNWQNTGFKNEKVRTLGFNFESTKILDAEVTINQIDNYTYFDNIPKPKQSDELVNYLKLKVFKGFTVGKFSLDNTIMYQNVASGADVFRVPEFVTRNSLYFSDHLFKNDPLYLQTGVTFKYFTEYKMNAYDAILADFYLQEELYGGFPLFDVFVNARVRRTRLFFKLENFTSRWTGRDYYSAPLHPYRDFTVRFGVVWDFFI